MAPLSDKATVQVYIKALCIHTACQTNAYIMTQRLEPQRCSVQHSPLDTSPALVL